MPPPLRITIESTADGYLRWEMFYGTERALHFSGYAPLLERVFEDLLRAQWVLAENLTDDPDPELVIPAHNTPDAAPIPQVHPPSGDALPAQQDIPATRHPAEPSTSIYPPPSSSG